MAATIHSDRRLVDRRLKQYFDSERSDWISVVKAAVAARAGRTEDDAKAAAGFYAWNAGTAEMRRIFRKLGWEKGDHGGIETIANPSLGKMVAVLNTDAGTTDPSRSPKNRTTKGAASEKIVDLNNQREMFSVEEISRRVNPPYSLWYLCIYDDGHNVRAELSRPTQYSGGYVVGYSERIFLLEDGDWEKIAIEQGALDDAQDFEIVVRRK